MSKKASKGKKKSKTVKRAAGGRQLTCEPGPLIDHNPYHPAIVASMITAMLLNATADRHSFESFECQLQSAVDLADAHAGERGADDYGVAVRTVQNFFNASNGNKDLFMSAHLAIKALLMGLIATGNWSVCTYVSQATIRDIYALPVR
jgi:hypothetical protein